MSRLYFFFTKIRQNFHKNFLLVIYDSSWLSGMCMNDDENSRFALFENGFIFWNEISGFFQVKRFGDERNDKEQNNGIFTLKFPPPRVFQLDNLNILKATIGFRQFRVNLIFFVSFSGIVEREISDDKNRVIFNVRLKNLIPWFCVIKYFICFLNNSLLYENLKCSMLIFQMRIRITWGWVLKFI